MFNQITMLYALSLPSATCQSYPSKSGRKKKASELRGRKKKKPGCLYSQITLKIKVPCLLWILIQSHKHQEKLNSSCNVLLWMNGGGERRGFCSTGKTHNHLGWEGMARKSHLFEQWITDLPISGRPARLMVGWGELR